MVIRKTEKHLLVDKCTPLFNGTLCVTVKCWCFYIAVVCPDPPEVVNGELQPISDDNYYFGDVPQYNCSSNYTLVTDDFKCGATATTGQWEGTLKCECKLMHCLFGIMMYANIYISNLNTRGDILGKYPFNIRHNFCKYTYVLSTD